MLSAVASAERVEVGEVAKKFVLIGPQMSWVGLRGANIARLLIRNLADDFGFAILDLGNVIHG